MQASLEHLLSMEKQHRLGEDVTATKMCCTAILEVLYEAKDWKSLNEHILLLSKRRSQLKQVGEHCKDAEFQQNSCSGVPRTTVYMSQTLACILEEPCRSPVLSAAWTNKVHVRQAVQAFVRQAMSYVDHTPDRETRIQLIKTLQSVTEGKVSFHQNHLLAMPLLVEALSVLTTVLDCVEFKYRLAWPPFPDLTGCDD